MFCLYNQGCCAIVLPHCDILNINTEEGGDTDKKRYSSLGNGALA